MGSGKGKSRRSQSSSPKTFAEEIEQRKEELATETSSSDNYEAQRAVFFTKIEEACTNGDEEAVEKVLEEIEAASAADLLQLRGSATEDEVMNTTLAWLSLTNYAVQRFYMDAPV